MKKFKNYYNIQIFMASKICEIDFYLQNNYVDEQERILLEQIKLNMDMVAELIRTEVPRARFKC